MVDRFGVFVDAGYLFAASGALCFGISGRTKLVMDCKTAIEALTALASEKCGLPYLRTYWYDGARDAQPTAQQLDVAHLPGVKLRLGRLVKGRQKGVDSRIVRDLIILSEERAVSVAYLVGGDEDLREGVSEAQERGVRVVLPSQGR
ncbi:MAG: NYN domain-containing protein [Actinomycetota bacterium]